MKSLLAALVVGTGQCRCRYGARDDLQASVSHFANLGTELNPVITGQGILATIPSGVARTDKSRFAGACAASANPNIGSAIRRAPWPSGRRTAPAPSPCIASGATKRTLLASSKLPLADLPQMTWHDMCGRLRCSCCGNFGVRRPVLELERGHRLLDAGWRRR